MGIRERSNNYGIMLIYQGFPDGSDGKESACNVGDPGSIPGEGNGFPRHFYLKNSMLHAICLALLCHF